MSMITQQQYAKRREQLISKLADNSVVLIPAGKEILRNGDAHYPFRQNSDFYYLTGFNEPDAMMLLTPGHEQSEYTLFVRPNDKKMEIWNGKRAGVQGAMDHYGADQAYGIDEFADRLGDLIANCDYLYYPIGADQAFDSQVMDCVNTLRARVRQGVNAPQHLADVATPLHEMRLIKSEQEIELMQRACDISATSHREAMQACKPGVMENALHSVLLKGFYERGCKAEAYTSIVGSGENTCILHYVENNALCQQGDLVLIDAGGEYENYASDITRTFPVSGRFSNEQKAIYELVLKAQLAAIDAVKPGTPCNHMQQVAIEVITQGLLDLGILQGDCKQCIADKAYQQFYMHNVSHWLGLDVHDVGAYKIDGQWRPLQAGMVLTIEPGIYIAANSEGVDAKWWNIGVRIEDDVLVTENGHHVLSANAPKTITEIEDLMNAAN